MTDPHTGTAYLTFDNSIQGGKGTAMYVSTSSNHGASWSTPIRLGVFQNAVCLVPPGCFNISGAPFRGPGSYPVPAVDAMRNRLRRVHRHRRRPGADPSDVCQPRRSDATERAADRCAPRWRPHKRRDEHRARFEAHRSDDQRPELERQHARRRYLPRQSRRWSDVGRAARHADELGSVAVPRSERVRRVAVHRRLRRDRVRARPRGVQGAR